MEETRHDGFTKASTRFGKRIPLNMHQPSRAESSRVESSRANSVPSTWPSTLFLIFVTNGRNELNSPRRTLSLSLSISISLQVLLSLSFYREPEADQGEKGRILLARTANITYGRLACLGYNRPRV